MTLVPWHWGHEQLAADVVGEESLMTIIRGGGVCHGHSSLLLIM